MPIAASSPTLPLAAPAAIPLARGRWALLLGLVLIVVPAWAYLLYLGWGMEHMDVGSDMLLMPRMTDWRAAGHRWQ